MSFDSTDASGWAVGWTAKAEHVDRWSFGQNDYVEYVGAGQSAAIKRTIYRKSSSPDPPDPRMSPWSLYVLEGSFSNVDWSSGSREGPIEIHVFGTVPGTAPTGGAAMPPVYGDNVVSLHPWVSFAPIGGFYVPKSTAENPTPVMDFYFWTFPTREDSTGWEGPFFEDLDSIWVQITISSSTVGTTMKAHDLSLEKRVSSLRNVLLWDDSGLDVACDLELTVKSDDGSVTYSEGSHYTLEHVEPLNYAMRTSPDRISTIEWTDTSVANVGDALLVSLTTGVPLDWAAGGAATTYCLNSPGFLNWVKSQLDAFYTGTYSFDPEHLTIRLDEIRGMNRCARCVQIGDTNPEHLVRYIAGVQSRLDSIAVTDPSAATCKIIVYAGSLQPANIGVIAGYQHSWGGEWGSMAATGTELHALNDSEIEVIFSTSFEYADTIRNDLGWPGQYLASGQSNVFVAGRMVHDQGNTIHQFPENSKDSTWYEEDAVGFLVASEYYGTNFSDAELRLLDYAWKRHRHPDVKLHAYRDGLFAGDGSGGDTLVVGLFEPVEFAPFATTEERDSTLGGSLTSATIDWDDGSPPVNIIDALNKDVVSQNWPLGTYDVTLSAAATGAPSRSATVTVRADTLGAVTIWSGNEPLTEDYVVGEGEVLIVEAGTKVEAQSYVRIVVHGTLWVRGTADSLVEFCYTDTTDVDGWDGIIVQDSVASAVAVIDHCIYRNAAYGLSSRNSLTIRNSTIRDCEKVGLNIAGSADVNAANVTVSNIPGGGGDVGVGINLLQSAEMALDTCTVEDAYWGALVYGQATLRASESTFKNHQSQAIRVFKNGEFYADACTTDGNTVGIYADSLAVVQATDSDFKNGDYGVYFSWLSTSASLNNCTFQGNEVGAYIKGSPNVTIANCSITDSDDEGIYCLAGSNITIEGSTISGGTVGVKCESS